MVDYLPAGFLTLNLGDIFQYIGIVMIFVLQFSKGTFDSEDRARLWVSPQFQRRYSFQLVTVGFFLVLTFGVLSYLFLRVVLTQLSVVAQIRDQFLQAYVAKPILRFEDYLRNLARGNYNVFQVDEPEFVYLEQLSDHVRDHLIEMNQEMSQMKVRLKARDNNEPN